MTDTAPHPGAAGILPVLKLSGPADVVAAVPYLLGFTPADSVVLLSLRGSRLRVNLTLRADLPVADDIEGTAADLAGHLARSRADAAIAAIYTGTRGADTEFWPALRTALAGREIAVQEALQVADGRWWSYCCDDPTCCPPEGTVILQPNEPGGPSRVGAELVGAGLAALGSRAELEDSVRPVDPTVVAALEALLIPATQEAARRAGKPGGLTMLRREWQRNVVRVLQERVRQHPPPPLSDRQLVDLLIALTDIPTRDAAASWATGRGSGAAESVISLWRELTRRAPPPYDVAPAALLAHAAWYAGNGALARVAVERALATDPTYRLATLIERLLDEGVDPATARRAFSRGRRGRG